MFNLNRDAMKDLKEIRLLSLLAALGLLYVGIDRVFFDRIVGGDPLSMDPENTYHRGWHIAERR